MNKQSHNIFFLFFYVIVEECELSAFMTVKTVFGWIVQNLGEKSMKIVGFSYFSGFCCMTKFLPNKNKYRQKSYLDMLRC